MSQGGYYWTPTLPAGTYWITAVAQDGYNLFTQVSKAPLVINSAHLCPPSYSDVPSGSTFYPYISNLECRNIVEGYSDNTFRPSDPAPRALLTRWVSLTRNWTPSITGGPHFIDVSPLEPLYTFVETGVAHGIIGGYTDGTFRPYNTVTRAQTAKMIVLAMGWPVDTTGGPHFIDIPPSDQFYGYIETLVNHGAVGGYSDGTYRGGNTLSRGQLSKILQISSP
jgi:hypothetical protein